VQRQQLQLAEEEVAVEADKLVGRRGLRERHRGRSRRRVRLVHGRRGKRWAPGDGDTTALVFTTHSSLQIGRERATRETGEQGRRLGKLGGTGRWRPLEAARQAGPRTGKARKTKNFKLNHVNPFCKVEINFT
jgi:hypothetical protein